MIKIFKCSGKNYQSKLALFLEKRKKFEKASTKKVIKIISDVKKNRTKALLKYERKFSKNHEIKPTYLIDSFSI